MGNTARPVADTATAGCQPLEQPAARIQTGERGAQLPAQANDAAAMRL
jgi:hypothetical protein